MSENNVQLNYMNLMSIAVGQIIGAGVMVMSISALGMTGRAVNIAFVMAAIMTVAGAVPVIFMSSILKIHGGTYTQYSLFLGELFGGIYTITYCFENAGIAMYASGMVSYLAYIFPSVKSFDTLLTVALMAAFFVLNLFGTEWMSKAQDFMFYLLVAALVMFTLFGLPKVQWGGYFGNELFGQPLFGNGLSGLLEAATFLTYATGGATVVVNFSAQAKNPTKDLPSVIIISTLSVALLYALMATVIGGVLPPDVVIERGNLAPIAQQIMPNVCYVFFILCGALFALGTTLNATIGWLPVPLMQSAKDGWLPAWVAKTNKHGAPYIIYAIFFVINSGCVLAGMDISEIGKMVLFIGNVEQFCVLIGMLKIPKMFPEAWAKSKFHVSDGVFKAFMFLAIGFMLMQGYMNCVGQKTWVIIVNVVVFIAAFFFAKYKLAHGAHVSTSYEVIVNE